MKRNSFFMQEDCVYTSKDKADTGLSVLIVPLTTQQLPHIDVVLAAGLKCITHTHTLPLSKSAVIIKRVSQSLCLFLPCFLSFFFFFFFFFPAEFDWRPQHTNTRLCSSRSSSPVCFPTTAPCVSVFRVSRPSLVGLLSCRWLAPAAKRFHLPDPPISSCLVIFFF